MERSAAPRRRGYDNRGAAIARSAAEKEQARAIDVVRARVFVIKPESGEDQRRRRTIIPIPHIAMAKVAGAGTNEASSTNTTPLWVAPSVNV